jgi:hypothetical protein
MLKSQSTDNNLSINGTEVSKLSTGQVTIQNLAVVDVDYFWLIDLPLANEKNEQGQHVI